MLPASVKEHTMEQLKEGFFFKFLEYTFCNELEKCLLRGVEKKFSEDDFFKNLNVSKYILIALMRFDFTKEEIAMVNELAAKGKCSFENMPGLSKEKSEIVHWFLEKLKCPTCDANLDKQRFQKDVVCPNCDAVLENKQPPAIMKPWLEEDTVACVVMKGLKKQ